MRELNALVCIVCATVTFLFAGCSTVKAPTDAKIANGRYENRYFKFQIQIPHGWTVLNEQNFKDARAIGSNGKDYQEADKVSHLLLFISEKPYGVAADSNPAVVLDAADLSSEPNIQTARQYEELIAQQLIAQSHWSQDGDIRTVKLGSKEFSRADFGLEVLGKPMHEAFFAARQKNYLLSMAVISTSEAEVEKILGLIGFGSTNASAVTSPK